MIRNEIRKEILREKEKKMLFNERNEEKETRKE